MKVIDLLNKIANGEEVPERVKAGYYYYELEENGEYINIDDTEDLLFDFDFPLEHSLNQEVEIIEEDKKIEKIWFSLYEMERVNKEVLEKIENKINEIIDYLEENKK